ncbi:ATP-binding protein, partial [Aquicoccus sp. SU-CL01552]|uniref:ATP-binding protein n=1 Tax=Aquicoccus sp. SU-CL01552 TaxID=3127656 RepID=UPI0033418B02
AHYTFPRAAVLREAFSQCVTDYFVKASNGGHFEARGLVVTGESRVGKTSETIKLIDEFNDSRTEMPGGKPGKIIYCKLDGLVTWKDLGRKTLATLGYPGSPLRTQSEIWGIVRRQSRGQGVIGVYYDECQHVFLPKGKSNRIFLDSFKSLMKEPEWPLILVLAGVPVLSDYVNSEEQLSHLLTPVHFDEISLGKSADPAKDPDMIELNKLVYAYAKLGGIDVEEVVDVDFLERLDFACSSRWGLVIELLVRTFALCRLREEKVATINLFAEAYAQNSRLPEEMSPFTAPDYRDLLDRAKLLELVQKA